MFFKQAAKRHDKVFVSDYAPYAPSGNAPAAFAAKAILDETGKALGVVAVQLPSEPINALLHFSEGMGKTGETYIVGVDRLMRSQSRFDEASTLLKQEVKTVGVLEALEGKSGARIIADYRGVPVLSVYSPVKNQMSHAWVLLAEIDEAEALQRLSSWWAVIFGLAASLGVVLLYNITNNLVPQRSVLADRLDGDFSEFYSARLDRLKKTAIVLSRQGKQRYRDLVHSRKR